MQFCILSPTLILSLILSFIYSFFLSASSILIIFSGSPIIKKETRSKDEKWKLIGIYTGNSSVELAKKSTFKEFLQREEIDIKSLIKDQHIKELFNLIDDYSKTLIRESYDFGIAVREDGIRDWLKGIDPSLYQ